MYSQQELHMEICHMFFDILEKHSLYLKPAKCKFFQMEVNYLGIHVKNGELMIDPAKLAGIRDWPTTLKNVKEVRSTLGLLGYHRPWILNFSKITKPLMDLLGKGREFAWDQICEDAVKKLLGLVTSESVMVPLDPNRQFILYVDVSQFATGAVLYQPDLERTDHRGNPLLRPLGFHSQMFNKAEQNYPIYDRELLAIIRGLRNWRHLMRNTTHPIMVITDHANLQYYREPQKIGPRVNGYIVELADYNIQLVYKPGSTNKADELSRRPDMAPEDEDELVIVLPNHLFAHPESPSTEYVATRTKPENYDSDSGYESDGADDTRNVVKELSDDSRHVIKNLADDSRDVLKDLAPENTALKARAANLGDGYIISAFELNQKIEKAQGKDASTLRQWERAHGITKQGDLWTREGALVVVGNNKLKRGGISLFHDTTTAGHPGITKTLALTRQYYWWPNMKNYATEYIKGCATCQMSKINTNPSKPALSPITPEPNALPFQTISLDFIVKLPESEGFDTILTITDHDCSKVAMFMPCNETVDTAGVAKLYATYVFPHYGLPRKVISDRDPRFASNFSREICSLLGIKQNISMAYHPQTDGQSKRMNQSLEQYLRLYCGSHQKDWAAWLLLAQYTRNSWPNASTKKTPYELILGYTPLAHQPIRDTATIPDIDTRIKLINNAREQAQEALKQTQETMIKETRFKEFEIGQKVWLEGKNIKRPYDSPKLSPKRYGPFRVVAKISPVAYKLQIPATWQVHDVFHASLLTPYKETVEHGKNFLEPPPDVIEGEEEWEVEQILAKRIFGRSKKLQFLVRWKGYSPAHDQWVNKEDMAADDLIRIFERENPDNAPVQRPARSKRIRATTVDFDSPDIASSQEASVEPADISAARTRTHWAHSLDQKERTWINGLVLLARAAVTFRAKHGKFPWKLRRGFFNLVHRLAQIEGKLTAYPMDFTAKNFRKFVGGKTLISSGFSIGSVLE